MIKPRNSPQAVASGRTQSLLRPALALLLTLSLSSALPAQTPDPTTLHVYANLVQVPVLVLSNSRHILPPIEPSRFRLSLNSGRPFQLTHVRLEGDDPINLAILIDETDTSPAALTTLQEAIVALSPGGLHPQDTVAVYSLACTLTRTRPVSPPDREALQAVLEAAMHSHSAPAAHHERCAQPIHVWRAIAYIVSQLAARPGRRVLLAVTSGHDADQSIRPAALAELATSSSVSLFALSTLDERGALTEPLLGTLCELTGGMVFYPSPHQLTATLQQFIAILRSRYIVSFPLPALRQAGVVNMEVTIAKLHGFIRPGGAGVPLPDPALATDPNTFLPDPTKAPELGKRRSLPITR